MSLMRILEDKYNYPWNFMDNFFEDIAIPSRSDFNGLKKWKEDTFSNIVVKEDDENLTIHLEVPEIIKDNIKIDIENKTLTISGEKKMKKKYKSNGFKRNEKVVTSFEKSIPLPEKIDESTLTSNISDGSIEISFKKKEDSKKIKEGNKRDRKIDENEKGKKKSKK